MEAQRGPWCGIIYGALLRHDVAMTPVFARPFTKEIGAVARTKLLVLAQWVQRVFLSGSRER
jgi:hypothetical protein